MFKVYTSTTLGIFSSLLKILFGVNTIACGRYWYELSYTSLVEFFILYFALGRLFAETVGYFTLKWIFLFSVICVYLVLIVCALYVYTNGLGVFLCSTYVFCLSYHTGFVKQIFILCVAH